MSVSNKQLTRLRDKEFAGDIKKYIRTSHEFYGTKIPELKILAKRLFEEYDLKDFYRIFNRFWSSGYHEERSLAIYTLELYKEKFDLSTWNFIKTKLKEIKSWDKVDDVAMNILGETVLRNPFLEKEIIAMSRSKNIWYKRMGIMASIMLVRNNNIKTSILMCEENLNNKDENVQKSVGLCLKEIGAKKPEVARRFILKNIKMPERIFYIATENMKDLRRIKEMKKLKSFYLNKLFFWKNADDSNAL